MMKFLSGIKSSIIGNGIQKKLWEVKHFFTNNSNYVDTSVMEKQKFDLDEFLDDDSITIIDEPILTSKTEEKTIADYLEKALSKYQVSDEESKKIFGIVEKIMEEDLTEEAIFAIENNGIVKDEDDFLYLITELELIVDDNELKKSGRQSSMTISDIEEFEAYLNSQNEAEKDLDTLITEILKDSNASDNEKLNIYITVQEIVEENKELEQELRDSFNDIINSTESNKYNQIIEVLSKYTSEPEVEPIPEPTQIPTPVVKPVIKPVSQTTTMSESQSKDTIEQFISDLKQKAKESLTEDVISDEQLDAKMNEIFKDYEGKTADEMFMVIPEITKKFNKLLKDLKLEEKVAVQRNNRMYDEYTNYLNNLENKIKSLESDEVNKYDIELMIKEIYENNSNESDSKWFISMKYDLKALYNRLKGINKKQKVEKTTEQSNDSEIEIDDSTIYDVIKFLNIEKEEPVATDIYSKREEIENKLAELQKKLAKKQKKFNKVVNKIKGSSNDLEHAISHTTDIDSLNKLVKHASSIKEIQSYIDILTKKLAYVDAMIDKKEKELEDERIQNEYLRQIEEDERKQAEYEQEYLQMLKEKEDAEYVKFWETANICSMSELNRLTDAELNTYIKLEKKMGLR